MVRVVASAINRTLIDCGTKVRVTSGTISGLQSRAQNRRWGRRRHRHALYSSTVNTFETGATHRRTTRGSTALHGTPSISCAGLLLKLFLFDRSCVRGGCAGDLCNGSREKKTGSERLYTVIRFQTQYYCNQFHTIPTCTFHMTMDESATQSLLTLAFPGVHTNPSQHIGGRLADAPHCCARPPSPAQLLGSIAPVVAGKVGIGTGKVGMGTGDVAACGEASISPAATRSSGVQHLMWRAPPDRLLHTRFPLHI